MLCTTPAPHPPHWCCSGQAAALAGGTTMHIDFALPVNHDLMAGWQAWKVRPTALPAMHYIASVIRADRHMSSASITLLHIV